MKAHTTAIEKDSSTTGRKRLLPLMFAMGRMLKTEMARREPVLPSFLHLETLRFIQDRQTSGRAPTMSEISDYVKVARPTGTALITSFVQDGILVRKTDSEDRRLVRLELSTKGKEVLKAAFRRRDLAFQRVISSLSEKDCVELARILSIITQKPL